MCTGIVLAGGKSTRMGTNKAFLKIDQELMVVRVIRQVLSVCSTCIVVTNTPDEFPVLENVSYQKDNYLDSGPLGGLEAGFAAARTEFAAVAACDMPAISSGFLKQCLDRMDSQTDAVMVAGQPLQAVYRTDVCLDRARYCLNHGEHSLKQFLRGLRVKEVTWHSQSTFANLNTRNDVLDYLANRSESFGPTKVPAVAIIGYSGSGKTTLIERLIPILMEKGWKVGTLKHDAHRFDVDHPGKDTYRHRDAGAAAVMITSNTRLALMVEQPKSMPIERLVDLLAEQGVDAVLIEGYKQTELPKVAVIRREEDLALLSRHSGIRICAVGGRFDPTRVTSETGIQCVSLDDAESLAKWVDQLWRDFNSDHK